MKTRICSNCNAPVPADATVCPYCHSPLPTLDQTGKIISGNIVKPVLSEKQLLEKIREQFENTDDLEDKALSPEIMNNRKHARYYVPVYLFDGTYQGYWSGEKSRDVEVRDLNSSTGKTTKTVWDPVDGRVTGNYSTSDSGCNKITLGKAMPGLNLFNQISKACENATKQEKVPVGEWKLLPVVDESQIWRGKSEDFGKLLAHSGSYEHAKNVRNFQESSSVTMNHATLYYLPFYAMTFQYKKKNYGVYIEAGSGECFKNLPVDKAYTSKVSNLNKERNDKLKKEESYGCLGIFISAIIFAMGSEGNGPGFWTWLLSLIALILGNFYTGDKKIIANSFICTAVYLVLIGIMTLFHASDGWKYGIPILATLIVAGVQWNSLEEEKKETNKAINTLYDTKINGINKARKRQRKNLLDNI